MMILMMKIIIIIIIMAQWGRGDVAPLYVVDSGMVLTKPGVQ
jgi:signal peptidase I